MHKKRIKQNVTYRGRAKKIPCCIWMRNLPFSWPKVHCASRTCFPSLCVPHFTLVLVQNWCEISCFTLHLHDLNAFFLSSKQWLQDLCHQSPPPFTPITLPSPSAIYAWILRIVHHLWKKLGRPKMLALHNFVPIVWSQMDQVGEQKPLN